MTYGLLERRLLKTEKLGWGQNFKGLIFVRRRPRGIVIRIFQ